MYLLDTDTIIFGLKDNSAVEKNLQRHLYDPIKTSALPVSDHRVAPSDYLSGYEGFFGLALLNRVPFGKFNRADGRAPSFCGLSAGETADPAWRTMWSPAYSRTQISR